MSVQLQMWLTGAQQASTPTPFRMSQNAPGSIVRAGPQRPCRHVLFPLQFENSNTIVGHLCSDIILVRHRCQNCLGTDHGPQEDRGIAEDVANTTEEAAKVRQEALNGIYSSRMTALSVYGKSS